MSGRPGSRRRGRPSALALVVLLVLVAGPAPGSLAIGPPVAAAQGGASSVPAPPVARGGASSVPASPPAERRKAAELRRVARDALAGRRGDDRALDLDDSLLGLGGVVWRILLVVLVGVVAVVGVSLYRRGPRRRGRRNAGPEAAGDATAQLEGRARRAEEQGEHRAAVVLWFRAGTGRLVEDRRVRVDGTATAGHVARESGDPRVGELAVAHDRAAYGPGPVGPDASRGAREGWAVVLREPAPPSSPEEHP